MRRLRELIAPKHRWRQLTNYVSSFPELSLTWCLTGEKGFSGSLVSSSHPTALPGTVFFPVCNLPRVLWKTAVWEQIAAKLAAKMR